METRTIRLGAGAGFARDRIEPAVQLAESGNLDYLIFECLAERTIALAQQERIREPERGYDPMLEARMRAVLPLQRTRHFRIVTNMGAANPCGAARVVATIAKDLGLNGLRIAIVEGDDVLSLVKEDSFRFLETGADTRDFAGRIVAANAYLGIGGICDALQGGADVVICGRVADPALFLAPLVHEFGWDLDDWTRLGQGTLVGHMLECAGQVSGGYYADPGFKDVPNIEVLGFPIGVVSHDGAVEITKLPTAGGTVSAATCKEQLIYEIHDPAQYFQPDVIADFSCVTVTEIGHDRVRLEGAMGAPRPDSLKVSVAYQNGYVGEAQISYGGPNATARADLARMIVNRRLRDTAPDIRAIRLDVIGVDALYGTRGCGREPHEVRLRVAVHTTTREQAEWVGREVESLYTNGPAGGGGVTLSARELISVQSILIPRQLVQPKVSYLEVQ